MDRATALSILRKHQAEFEASGVAHLRLFGSFARDQATESSDVDVLVDFDFPDVTLIDLGAVHTKLAHLLETDVDLLLARSLQEPLRSAVLQEAVFAF